MFPGYVKFGLHLIFSSSILVGGGGDVGKLRTLELMFNMKRDLHHFKLSSPNINIIFSEIVPRLIWLCNPEF